MWGARSNGNRSKTRLRPRRANRLKTDTLRCELGDIVDISASGMRVRAQGKPPVKVGQVLEVKLQSGTHRLRVRAQTVWIRRRGIRAYEIGLHFINANRSITAAVESLAMFGFIDLEAAAKAKLNEADPEGEAWTAAVELPDYYRILKIEDTATAEDIQQAYRALARKFHPDVTDDPAGAEIFMRITEAYEALRDPRSRKSYDARKKRR